MKFKKGHIKVGGRKKGTRAYKSQLFAEVLEENNFCPATAMIKLYEKAGSLAEKMMADKKKPKPTACAMFLKIASDMAKELACYAYPHLQAIEIERHDPLVGMTAKEKLDAMRDAVKLLEHEVQNGPGDAQQPH